MALTFTDVKRFNYQKSGGVRQAMIDITFDSSYATGGWAITPANVGMSLIYGLISLGPQVAAAGVDAARIFEVALVLHRPQQFRVHHF